MVRYRLNFEVSSVPEPSTWAMLLACISLMLRRAKQTKGFLFKDAFTAWAAH